MNVDETKQLMLDAVGNAKVAMLAASESDLSRKVIEDCRTEIEQLRMAFKRRIDERAKHSGNRHAFPVNARAGIERKLEQTTRQMLDAVDAMSKTVDEQNGD